MTIFRKKQSAGDVWKSHVIAKMKEPHCWICEQAVSEVGRDFFWFTSEQYYEPGVVDTLRLAHGFCPTHTRHFLQTGAKSVITAVYSYLTWYVIKQLYAARDILSQKKPKQSSRDLCLEAAEALRPQGICPMCATLQKGEEINIHALTHTLALVDVRGAYENSPGLCLPHFRQVANQAEWDTAVYLNADMRGRLHSKVPLQGSTTALLEQTIGVDRVRSLRRGAPSRELRPALYRKQHGSESYIDLGKPDLLWSPTFEQLLTQLAEPGCSVCNACDRGVQQYLVWLALEMESKWAGSDSWEATYHVCPSHLWALYAAGYDQAAMRVGEHSVQEWIERLNRLAFELNLRPSERALERLRQGLRTWCGAYNPDVGRESEGPRSRWKKAKAVLEPPKHRLDSLRAIAFRADLCQLCAHVQTTTRQRLDLILRALEDPAGRKAYHAGSGLCLRHCVEAANLAEVPAALAELLSAQIGRLRLLEWELEEASRKVSWSVRYEPKGPESDAWRRAAKQFCGV
jgi:hypothetical protein